MLSSTISNRIKFYFFFRFASDFVLVFSSVFFSDFCSFFGFSGFASAFGSSFVSNFFSGISSDLAGFGSSGFASDFSSTFSVFCDFGFFSTASFFGYLERAKLFQGLLYKRVQLFPVTNYPTPTSVLRHCLFFGFVRTVLFVLIITHAGTDEFCFSFFISLIFLGADLWAPMKVGKS